MTYVPAITQAIERFHNCCQTIIAAGTGPGASKSLNYAVAYAEAGTQMTSSYMIKVQALYVLNNITHWRGPIAKAVRTDLKTIVKQLS